MGRKEEERVNRGVLRIGKTRGEKAEKSAGWMERGLVASQRCVSVHALCTKIMLSDTLSIWG